MARSGRAGKPLWDFPTEQFCDDPDFVNGDLDRTGRRDWVGADWRRVAQWCVALGANVVGYDPFLSPELIRSWGVQPTTMDALVETAEAVFVLVPPTPSARHLSRTNESLISARARVVVATGPTRLTSRRCASASFGVELAGAFDVYDVEPLPIDDPLRDRPNVVHTPHIAGRTRDANLRWPTLSPTTSREFFEESNPSQRFVPIRSPFGFHGPTTN